MGASHSNALAWREPWDSSSTDQHPPPPFAPVAPPPHPTYDLMAAIKAALDEDSAGIGDLTTLATIPSSTRARATFRSKASGTLAGVAVAHAVLLSVDGDGRFKSCYIQKKNKRKNKNNDGDDDNDEIKVSWRKRDGDRVRPGDVIGVAVGSARSLLVAERVALNFMQRMSGIATATRAMVDAAASRGGKAVVLDTRKTAPGLRLVDKWAVSIGGGQPHRMGLFDMIMVKDNHAAAAGGVSKAADAASRFLRNVGQEQVPIEVEASTLVEVEAVLSLVASRGGPGTIAQGKSGITRLMLDNMVKVKRDSKGNIEEIDVSMLSEAVGVVCAWEAKQKNEVSLETEASGNITVETVGVVSATGVSHVSTGALTHSVMALDVSLGMELLSAEGGEEEGEVEVETAAAVVS